VFFEVSGKPSLRAGLLFKKKMILTAANDILKKNKNM
jgi:hypothetical protein